MSVLITNYDTSKIFVWNNRSQTENLANGTGAEKTYDVGLVMGRVFATGALLPSESDAVDGSEIPVGILAETYTIGDGESTDVSICIGGDVVQNKLVFNNGTDDLETKIVNQDNRPYRDAIQGMTLGVKLVPSTELTEEDNQ